MEQRAEALAIPAVIGLAIAAVAVVGFSRRAGLDLDRCLGVPTHPLSPHMHRSLWRFPIIHVVLMVPRLAAQAEDRGSSVLRRRIEDDARPAATFVYLTNGCAKVCRNRSHSLDAFRIVGEDSIGFPFQ
jgi:hypothetical protein